MQQKSLFSIELEKQACMLYWISEKDASQRKLTQEIEKLYEDAVIDNQFPVMRTLHKRPTL